MQECARRGRAPGLRASKTVAAPSGKAAGREVAAALDAERDALAELGFDSYPAFLLAMAEGRAEGDGAHDAAALQTAEAALARARERETAFVELSERELDLRRPRGPSARPPSRTRRRRRAPHRSRDDRPPRRARDRLENVLRSAGAPVGDDPIAAAERWLTAAGVAAPWHARR